VANFSMLFCSDSEGTPRQGRDKLTYSGRYQVPLFWLASLRPSDVRYVIDKEGDRLPYTDATPASMLDAFRERKQALSTIAAGIVVHFAAWETFLQEARCGWIKIDPTEVIFMVGFDPKQFEAGIAFFEAPTLEGFNAVLSLTSLTDVLDRSVKPPVLRLRPLVTGIEINASSSVYLTGYPSADP
jgi:hypothetical protein